MAECKNRSKDGSRTTQTCTSMLIDGMTQLILDWYDFGAGNSRVYYPMVKGENEPKHQELNNEVVSYLETRFKVTQHFGADFNLDNIKIIDTETNDIDKEEVNLVLLPCHFLMQNTLK